MCRTLAVHFTDPFHVNTRIADTCNDGTLLLQVICAHFFKSIIFCVCLDFEEQVPHCMNELPFFPICNQNESHNLMEDTQ